MIVHQPQVMSSLADTSSVRATDPQIAERHRTIAVRPEYEITCQVWRPQRLVPRQTAGHETCLIALVPRGTAAIVTTRPLPGAESDFSTRGVDIGDAERRRTSSAHLRRFALEVARA
jgi:hypothetical protein